MDRQTDRIALLQQSALQAMWTRCKNHLVLGLPLVFDRSIIQNPPVSAICHSTHMTDEIQLLLHHLLNYVTLIPDNTTTSSGVILVF